MTKVTIIGEEQPKEKPKEKKKIEFVETIAWADGEKEFKKLIDGHAEPKDYYKIVLICRDFKLGYDLMYAYGSPMNANAKNIYLGHFNDGKV